MKAGKFENFHPRISLASIAIIVFSKSTKHSERWKKIKFYLSVSVRVYFITFQIMDTRPRPYRSIAKQTYRKAIRRCLMAFPSLQDHPFVILRGWPFHVHSVASNDWRSNKHLRTNAKTNTYILPNHTLGSIFLMVLFFLYTHTYTCVYV